MSSALDTRFDETDLSTNTGSTVPSGVFDEFAGPVWAIAMHALGDAAQADQVVEASFATFTPSPGALAATVDPGTVLFSTARRIIFERLLADSSNGRRDAPSAAASWERWGSAVALGRLSEVELAVARLKHENGLASGAIAASLGLSQETIERHEDRAHTVIGVRLITDEDLFEAHRPPDLELRARLVGGGPSAGAARIEPPHAPFVAANRPRPPHPHSVPPSNRPVVVSASTLGEVPDNVLLSWDPPVVRQSPGSHLSLWAWIVAVGASVRGGVGPGLVLAAMGAMTAQMLQQFVPGASTLVLAVLVGVVIGNLGIATEATRRGSSSQRSGSSGSESCCWGCGSRSVRCSRWDFRLCYSWPRRW